MKKLIMAILIVLLMCLFYVGMVWACPGGNCPTPTKPVPTEVIPTPTEELPTPTVYIPTETPFVPTETSVEVTETLIVTTEVPNPTETYVPEQNTPYPTPTELAHTGFAEDFAWMIILVLMLIGVIILVRYLRMRNE